MPLLQAVAEKTFAHRKRRADKTDFVYAPFLRFDPGWFDNMQERDRYRRRNLRRNEMHGVRAEHDAMRTARFKMTGGVGQPDACDVPLSVALKLFDRREIHAMQQDLRGVQAAKARAHVPV